MTIYFSEWDFRLENESRFVLYLEHCGTVIGIIYGGAWESSKGCIFSEQPLLYTVDI